VHGHPGIDEPAFKQEPPNRLIRDELDTVIWKFLLDPPQSWYGKQDVPKRTGMNNNDRPSHRLPGWMGFSRMIEQQLQGFKISRCINIQKRPAFRIDLAQFIILNHSHLK